MFSTNRTKAVARGAALAVVLGGLATLTSAPANAAPKFSAIAYSTVTGAWGWSMLGRTPQEASDIAYVRCMEAGGQVCKVVAQSPPGGCVALARRDNGIFQGGSGPTSAAAQRQAYEIGGNLSDLALEPRLLVSTCSGGDSESAPVTGRGGVSPLPTPVAPSPPPTPVTDPGPSPVVSQLFATATADVDVYNVKNEPDGAGQVVGILRVGHRVSLTGTCTPEEWCEITGDNVPGGRGWVWGHLDLPE